MKRFVKGDIVAVPFTFSDLTNSKKRPALVFLGLIKISLKKKIGEIKNTKTDEVTQIICDLIS